MKKLVLAGACLLSLAGCDAIKTMIAPKDEAPAAAPAAEDPADIARAAFKAPTVIVPSADLGKRLSAATGVTATVTEHNTLIVTAGPDAKDNSGGKTSGASIALTPKQEAEFAGTALTVKVLARSGNGGTVTSQVAYSTNDVGNSRWRKFEVGPDYSEFSFKYKVPPINAGAGDFIGFLPVDGPIEVAAIGFASKPLPAPAPADAAVDTEAAPE